MPFAAAAYYQDHPQRLFLSRFAILPHDSRHHSHPRPFARQTQLRSAFLVFPAFPAERPAHHSAIRLAMNSNGVGQAPPESHEYQHRVGQSAGCRQRLVNHRRASFSQRHDFERNVAQRKSARKTTMYATPPPNRNQISTYEGKQSHY